MQQHLIRWLNILFFILIGVLITSGLVVLLFRKTPEQTEILPRKTGLPPTSFCPKDYKELGKSGLQLEYRHPKMGVPDLRKVLNYRGRNTRPDAKDKEVLFFSIGNSDEVFSVPATSKQYLIPNSNPDVPYLLSPENLPSSLWFEPELNGSLVTAKVRLKDEKGETVGESNEKGSFVLTEKPLGTQNKTFMIDNFRADPSLLARQKARWHGKDLFMEDHGGEEFEKEALKQRIVLGEGEAQYLVYVDKGDILIWKEGRWHIPAPGEPTAGFPLLRVNKIEDRVMNLELFDVSGKVKVSLNLLRLSEPPLQPLVVVQDFQFIGARTKVHSLFKVSNKREMIGPEDWFILTPEGWKKVKHGKEIDAYIEGKLQGILLIVNRIGGFNEEKWLEGTLYSRFRSQSEPIILPLRPGQKPPVKVEEEEKELPRNGNLK